jgi:DeoR family transcriptional regulator, copper-sensing transcriptional repressor
MTSDLPATRQLLILEWLQEHGTLTIEDIASRLHVSQMTIHRDVVALVQQGQVEKVHGGVRLPRRIPAPSGAPVCKMCAAPVGERVGVIIHSANAEPVHACCPHCAMMLLSDNGQAASALARDFIYGRIVNMRQAAFVLESDIIICCVPSVLCFAGAADAERFQRGFGGALYTFDALQAYLRETHLFGHSHHPH